MIPDWLAVVILGLIEGLTEFIPVSSTGHLLLAESWLPRQSELFNVIVQCGAALAIIPVFSGRLAQLAFRWHEPETRDFTLKLFAAFCITCIGGFALKKSGYTLPEEAWPVAMATFVGGFIIIGIEAAVRHRTLTEEVTWLVAVVFGIAQLLAAVFPGASRSGTTILLALALGLNRPRATEFSFLLGLPTLLAAGVLEVAHHFMKPVPGEVVTSWPMIFLGTVVSAISAFVVVKWLIHFVQHHTFTGFAIYRILLGAVLLYFCWPK